MGQIKAKLFQLRGLFIFYFLVQLAVDIILGWGISQKALHGLGGFGPGRLPISPGALLTSTLLISGALFAAGLWLFHQLLQKKNWARIILLVVGWLSVIDAVFSLLFTSGHGFTPWLERIVPGLDWQRVLLIDRVKDLIGLVFWGYLIYVLLITPDVKRDFLPAGDASDSENRG